MQSPRSFHSLEKEKRHADENQLIWHPVKGNPNKVLWALAIIHQY